MYNNDNNVASSNPVATSLPQFIEIKANLSTELCKFASALAVVRRSNECSLPSNTDLYDKLDHDIKRLEKYIVKDSVESTSDTFKAQFKHASRLQKHVAKLQENLRINAFGSDQCVDRLRSQADEITDRIFQKTTYAREMDV